MPATVYHRSYHRFLLFVACCTFLLLIAGGLVTSNNAGLAVPDWPNSFGHLPLSPGYFTKVRMVSGVLFEHGHRILAQFVGFLTILVGLWTWKVEKRPWMRKLGWAALGLVIVQGVFGGITVLFKTPPVVSSVHAALAQTFFATTVLMVLFTGSNWLNAPLDPLRETASIGMRKLTVLLLVLLYLQLMTGAAFRHVWTKLGPDGSREFTPHYIVTHFFVLHIINLVLLVAVILWIVAYAMRSFGSVRQIRRPALLLLGLLQVQFGLGIFAYLTRVEWRDDLVQPTLPLVSITVAHLVTGALMLATAAVLTAQTYRLVAAERRELAPAGARKASIA